MSKRRRRRIGDVGRALVGACVGFARSILAFDAREKKALGGKAPHRKSEENIDKRRCSGESCGHVLSK